METVIKTTVIYFFLLLLLRLAGRRAMARLSSFDFVLLLIIGGTTQRALLGQDYSVTNAFLVIVTLILLDVGLSLLERDHPSLARIINGSPLIVVEEGRPLHARLRRARLTENDILAVARSMHGIDRFEHIKFAVLEAAGDISIIPVEGLGGR